MSKSLITSVRKLAISHLFKVGNLNNQKKIDQKDAKILRTLLNESRTSLTELAKICEISVGAVRMRYLRMCRDGIINGEEMRVNPHSLGYKYITDLGIKTSAENESAVFEFITEKPYISNIVGPFGKYAFWAKVALHDTQKLAAILEDLESEPKIENIDSFIWVEAINIEYPENLILGPFDNKRKEEKYMKKNPISIDEIRIDEIDRKIAQILSQKSRTPFRKIGEQLGISTKNVVKRYRKLRKNVLLRSTITIDLSKFGYTALSNTFVKAKNRSKLAEIRDQILDIPNTIVIIRLIGQYDLYISTALANFEDLFNLTERIRKIPDIEKTESFVCQMVPKWPLNLFPSLLESERMEPKVFAYSKKQ